MNTRKNTKRLTVSAMISALSVTLLYLGSFIEVLDITMAVTASLFSAVMVIEYGKGAPWSVFGVTSVLSLILLPQKLPALMYALFFGYYPIIKEYVEKIRNKLVSWIVKLFIFSFATALLLLLSKLFLAETDMPAGALMTAIFLILSAAMLILYDVALTRMISYYIIKLRHRFKNIF